MMREPEHIRVPVRGGELDAARWNTGVEGPLVVAVHGITANSRAWQETADALKSGVLVAPDLRGRGGSADLPEPYSIREHARDVVDLIQHAGWADRDDLVLVGHSMGCFVLVAVAEELRSRGLAVPRLILVDGGLPLPSDPTLSPEERSQQQLGPILARLSMEFASREDAYAFWQSHPSFRGVWSEAIQAYADHDLGGAEPHLRSRANPDAIAANATELSGNDEYVQLLAKLADSPVTLLRAPRDLVDQPPGLYSPDDVVRWQESLPAWSFVDVDDTNHYTILMTAGPAAIIAREIDKT